MVMLGQGSGVSAVAKATGLSRQAEYRIQADPAGAETSLALWGGLTSRAKAAEVAALKAEGRSVRAIAVELGISVGSVHGMLKGVV